MDLKNIDYAEKYKLARNPSTPLNVLRELAKNKNWYVRYNVARNPKVSSNLLVMLFEYEKSLSEPEGLVIRTLYAHKNLPAFAKRIIETLFRDTI